MNYLTFFFKLSAALSLVVISPFSLANCSINGGGSTYVYSIALPSSTFKLSRNQATGPIGTEITASNGTARPLTCTTYPAMTMLKFGNTMTPSPTAPAVPAGVYNTNIEGIGIQVIEDFATGGAKVPVSNTLQKWYDFHSDSTNYLTGIKVQFYITGPITVTDSNNEIILPSSFIEAWANTSLSTAGGVNYNTLNISGKIKVEVMSCETPDITVDLGKQSVGGFSGVYSKSREKPFNFEIRNCDPGMNSVHYTFKPAPGITLEQSGSVNQYITLNSSSTASGVGIQVLYSNGDIVPFGSPIQYTGYSTSAGGSYLIPMKARYIQTASTISGGMAESAVEFTMSYE